MNAAYLFLYDSRLCLKSQGIQFHLLYHRQKTIAPCWRQMLLEPNSLNEIGFIVEYLIWGST